MSQSPSYQSINADTGAGAPSHVRRFSGSERPQPAKRARSTGPVPPTSTRVNASSEQYISDRDNNDTYSVCASIAQFVQSCPHLIQKGTDINAALNSQAYEHNWTAAVQKHVVQFLRSDSFRANASLQHMAKEPLHDFIQRALLFVRPLSLACLKAHRHTVIGCLRPFLLPDTAEAYPGGASHGPVCFDDMLQRFCTTRAWSWQYASLARLGRGRNIDSESSLLLIDAEGRDLVVTTVLMMFIILIKVRQETVKEVKFAAAVGCAVDVVSILQHATAAALAMGDSVTEGPNTEIVDVSDFPDLHQNWSRVVALVSAAMTSHACFVRQENPAPNKRLPAGKRISVEQVFDVFYASSSTAMWKAFLCTVGDVYKGTLDNSTINTELTTADENDVGNTLASLLLHTRGRAVHLIHMAHGSNSALGVHAQRATEAEIEVWAQSHITPCWEAVRPLFNVVQLAKETSPPPSEPHEQDAVDVSTSNKVQARPASRQLTIDVTERQDLTLNKEGSCPTCRFPWAFFSLVQEMVIRHQKEEAAESTGTQKPQHAPHVQSPIASPAPAHTISAPSASPSPLQVQLPNASPVPTYTISSPSVSPMPQHGPSPDVLADRRLPSHSVQTGGAATSSAYRALAPTSPYTDPYGYVHGVTQAPVPALQDRPPTPAHRPQAPPANVAAAENNVLASPQSVSQASSEEDPVEEEGTGSILDIMQLPANNKMSLRKLLSAFAELCPLEQEAGSRRPEQWFREQVIWRLPWEEFMPQHGVIKYHNDFVGIWMSIIAYDIYNTFYELAMQRNTWNVDRRYYVTEHFVERRAGKRNQAKMATSTLSGSYQIYRRFNVLSLTLTPEHTDGTHAAVVVLAVVTDVKETQMALSAELTFIGGPHAHLETRLNGSRSFRARATVLDYIGTQATTIDAIRKVDTLSSPVLSVLLGGRTAEHTNTPWTPFEAHVVPDAEDMQRYIAKSFVSESTKWLLVNRLETLREKNDDGMEAQNSVFDAYGRMNNEQCFAVVEAARLMHEFRHGQQASIGSPANKLAVVGPAGTGKTACILFTLSALYSDDNVSRAAEKVELARRAYMETVHGDDREAAPEEIQAAREAYDACEQPANHLRIAIVTPTHKALDEIEQRISWGFPIVYPARYDGPEIEYGCMSFFPLYDRTSVLQQRQGATGEEDDVVEQFSMQKGNLPHHVRKDHVASIVLTTIGSVAKCFQRAFWCRYREERGMPQYDLVINDEGSLWSVADGATILVNFCGAAQQSSGSTPCITFGDPLQGGPVVKGPRTRFTNIAAQSFMGALVPMESREVARCPYMYLSRQYRMHPIIGDLSSIVSGRQVINMTSGGGAPYRAYYCTEDIATVNNPAHPLYTTPLVWMDCGRKRQTSETGLASMQGVVAGRHAQKDEAVALVHCVHNILQQRRRCATEILVTTPYRDQQALLSGMLENLSRRGAQEEGGVEEEYDPARVEVTTTKTVQGRENKLVMYCTSRTAEHANSRRDRGSFAVDVGHIYVAITRAECELMLFVHGDYLCAQSEIWEKMRHFTITNSSSRSSRSSR